MTWRRVDDPNIELDTLIEAYFVDQKLLAASTRQLLAEHRPIPEAPLAGYDGRLADWLTEMANFGPPDGPERAWPIVLELIARAPDDEVLTFVGVGPIEGLVNNHGKQFEDRIVTEALRDPRFRLALSHVWPHDDAPNALQELVVASRSLGGG